MLLYITGGVGFLLSVLSIFLILIFHKKDKSKIVPLIIYFLGFVLFMGSGFLHWKGFELSLPFFNSEPDSPLDLIGEWKQTNSASDEAYQGIYISDNTIEVYWVTENGDTTALYWAGSFTPPADSPKEYTWESENDTSRTGTALMASGDAAKEFTYKNGKLSYSASAFGVTTTIEAEKGEWGYQGSTSSSSQNESNITDGSGTAEPSETSSSADELDNTDQQEPSPGQEGILLGSTYVPFELHPVTSGIGDNYLFDITVGETTKEVIENVSSDELTAFMQAIDFTGTNGNAVLMFEDGTGLIIMDDAKSYTADYGYVDVSEGEFTMVERLGAIWNDTGDGWYYMTVEEMQAADAAN